MLPVRSRRVGILWMERNLGMRTVAALLLGMTTVACSGCSICSEGFLDDYATVGGKWQRSDPVAGRVGSIFSDPGTTIGDSVAETANGHDPEESYPPADGEEVFYDYGPEIETYEGQAISAPQYEDDAIILSEDW